MVSRGWLAFLTSLWSCLLYRVHGCVCALGGCPLGVGVARVFVSMLTAPIASTGFISSTCCRFHFESCLLYLHALVVFVARLCGLILRWVLLFRSQVEHRLITMHHRWHCRSCTYMYLFFVCVLRKQYHSARAHQPMEKAQQVLVYMSSATTWDVPATFV